MLLRLARKITPRSWRRRYHLALATLAAFWYRYPARELIVIGITGTDGKTTTATMTAAVLAASGANVGLTSSVYCQVGAERWMNTTHMTMPGRFALQRLLRRMVQAGCSYAVLEVSSEGLAQSRLQGIDVDIAAITNLSPEHIEAHGSFEAYRAAKGRLFQALTHAPKRVHGKTIATASVVNLDDDTASFYLEFPVHERFGTTLKPAGEAVRGVRLVQADQIEHAETGAAFMVEGNILTTRLPGVYNVRNALQAVAMARALDIPWEAIRKGLADLTGIPGRFEEIRSPRGFSVVIDYALTPAALASFFQSVHARNPKRVIAVFGAAGGGRDTWKRPQLGEIASQFASQIIITTDDPFDEDPAAIAQEIRSGIPTIYPGTVEVELDRRSAIASAITQAQAGDIVTITGMGAEMSMNVAGGKQVPWSDTEVVKEAIAQCT